MIIMLRFEIKKIFLKPLNKIIIGVLLAVTVLGAVLAIKDVQYITNSGEQLTGISAGQHLREDIEKWEGTLDDDLLKKVIQKNDEINKKSSGDEAYRQKQGIDGIREMINVSFSGMNNYDYYVADNISENEVGNLYEKRISGLKDWLNSEDVKGTFTQEEEQYLIDKFEELETPFYYEYTEGWKALLDSPFLPTLLLIVVVGIGFLVSGIFSDEFRYKAESIFYSTKLGRNKAIMSKMGAGCLTITVVYWASMILYSLIILFALGFDGMDSTIQSGATNWFSMYNLTYLQAYLLVMIGGYIGCFFILMLSMFVSAVSRSTVFEITIPFIFACIPMFLGRISFFARIITLFPDMLLRINMEFKSFLLYSVGGHITSVYGILFPCYFILSLVFIPLIYQVYKKLEVK